MVSTRTPSPVSAIRRARKYAVEDESRKIVSPGVSSANAASASRTFASAAATTRCENEFSGAAIEGRTAPPCVRRALPRSSSATRSRRAVIGDTPKRAWS